MQHLIWNIDPIFLDIGFLKIRWYGLMFALGFAGSFSAMQWMYQREGKNIEELDTLLWYMVIATIVGARLGHTLLYDPAYYLSHPLKILAVWEGGLASHGAALGIIFALFLYKRRYGDGFMWLLDRVSIATALPAGLIRIGNFFNSEILGVPSDLPWAVVFARVDALPRHPVQLYEAISYLLIFGVSLLIYKKYAAKPGFTFGCYLLMMFSARFLLEFCKIEQAMYETGFELTAGQLLSIPFLLAGTLLVMRTGRIGASN